MKSRSEIISALEGLSIWGGDCNMLNEAQSKVRDTEGKRMGNQCALHIAWPGQDLECMILHMREILLSSLAGEETEFQSSEIIYPSLSDYKANFPPPHHMLSPMMLVTQNPWRLMFPAAFTRCPGWEDFRHRTTALHGESNRKKENLRPHISLKTVTFSWITTTSNNSYKVAFLQSHFTFNAHMLKNY